MISEILFLETFEIFVLPGGKSGPFFGENVGKGGERVVFDSAPLPFVSKFLTSKPFLSPSARSISHHIPFVYNIHILFQWRVQDPEFHQCGRRQPVQSIS